jgi:hypothetical protein
LLANFKRHGTTSLFAALDTRSSKIIGQTQQRHRSGEFRNFLDTIEKNVPAELDVHLIPDNYGTHQTQAVRNWLAKRPRWGSTKGMMARLKLLRCLRDSRRHNPSSGSHSGQ